MFVNVQNNIFTIDRRSSNFPESCPWREGPYFFNRRRGSSLTSKKEDHLLNLIGSLFMQKKWISPSTQCRCIAWWWGQQHGDSYLHAIMCYKQPHEAFHPIGLLVHPRKRSSSTKERGSRWWW